MVRRTVITGCLVCMAMWAAGSAVVAYADDGVLQLTPVESTVDSQTQGEVKSQGEAIAPVSKIKPSVDNGSQAEQKYDPEQLFSEPSDLQKQAYQSMTQQAMPLTPEQIVQLKKMQVITQRAAAAPADVPPKPVLSSRSVNLTPGANPPVVRLQQGFVTSVVFVDSTGANWPIAAYDLGNSQAFDIQWQRDSNTLMIQATSMYTYGNLAVTLQGLSTPVMLTLVPGQKEVDYRVDLHIRHAGPNALPVHHAEWGSVSDVLLSLLDGVPPQGAKEVETSESEFQAWCLGDKMYIRTKLAILSPGWINKTTSPDGTNAYEMIKTPTVVVSKYGNPVDVSVEGM